MQALQASQAEFCSAQSHAIAGYLNIPVRRLDLESGLVMIMFLHVCLRLSINHMEHSY